MTVTGMHAIYSCNALILQDGVVTKRLLQAVQHVVAKLLSDIVSFSSASKCKTIRHVCFIYNVA